MPEPSSTTRPATAAVAGPVGTAEPADDDVHLTLNGAALTLSCGPDTLLLDVLRSDLGLSGPRFGCGSGLCGTCFVLIDGRPTASCGYPAPAAGGTEITTVEGLAASGELHAVQQAFLDEQAAQCGYCTAGMIISAAALLRARPAPTAEEVREALDGNLCRCGTQQRIVRAVLRAARSAAAPGGAGETAGTAGAAR